MKTLDDVRTRWEYRSVKVFYGAWPQPLSDADLNFAGSFGWEVVVAQPANTGGGNWHVLLFRRALPSGMELIKADLEGRRIFAEPKSGPDYKRLVAMGLVDPPPKSKKKSR